MNLWTVNRLNHLDRAIRRKLKFYAPLTGTLHFWGVDPVSFARAAASTATWRDGAAHDVAANVPRFEFDGDLPLGIKLDTGETLQFSAQNGLDDSATVIWFESGVPMSTPTNSNPFDPNGNWTGNLGVHVKHIVKAKSTVSNAEIAAIQTLLEDVAQEFPDAPTEPPQTLGQFINETPSGSRNGSNTVFTLSQDPELNSLLVSWGGLWLKRVASSPAELQFTSSGSGGRTITLGSAPQSTEDLSAQYVAAS